MDDPSVCGDDDRLVCGDCGHDLDPADAVPVFLANTVMSVCPRCWAIRQELDALLS